MSYKENIDRYKDFDFEGYFSKVSENDILRSLNKRKLAPEDFLNLISPLAEQYLEVMAQKANEITERNFGKTIMFFTPLYIANICVNRCVYCSYNIENQINRLKLTGEEIEKECIAISEKGFKNILLLTGESIKDTPVDYLVESINVVKKYFPSIGIEVYPMDEDDYRKVIGAGVDSLTVYQEVYDEDVYKKVHLGGPKRNYKYRLDAPERGAKAGMRNVNIGALLGLSDFRKEIFFTALHGEYLKDKYNEVEVGFSTPRIRPHAGVFEDVVEVNDKNIAQCVMALRIYHPTSVITMSSRERAGFRENLLPLGVNKISASVSVEIGGHTLDGDKKGSEQFTISDSREVSEIKEELINRGYQPIFKDWERI